MKRNYINKLRNSRLWTLPVAMLCCMACLLLTSCDDEEGGEAVEAMSTYTVTFGDDFFKAARVVISYRTTDNKTRRDTVTSGTTWTMMVHTTKFPVETGYEVAVQPYGKNAQLEADSTYNLTMKGFIEVSTSKGASYANNKEFITADEGAAVLGKDVEKLFYDHQYSLFCYYLTKDGNIQSTNYSF